MTNYYISDTHFGHANIIKYSKRPWTTTKEMDDALVERWNSVVKPTDTVYHLGDVSMGPKGLGPVSRLNGHITLFAGNHDDCWDHSKAHKGNAEKQVKLIETYEKAGFDVVNSTGNGVQFIGKYTVNVAHLPYYGDSRGNGEPNGVTDRYKEFRLVSHKPVRPIICGHVHDAWAILDRQINVGVDAPGPDGVPGTMWDYTPVSEERLEAIIDEF